MKTRNAAMLVAAAAVLAVTLGSGLAGAARVYKWVDENGVTHYGDSIPPEYSKKTHDVFNEQGAKVETVNAPEPEVVEQPKVQDTRQRDRALLATYSSVGEIERVRDRRLSYLDDQNQVAADRLEALTLRLGELETHGGDQNELAAVMQRIGEYRAEIERRNDEKERIAAAFEADIVRFRELRGTTPE